MSWSSHIANQIYVLIVNHVINNYIYILNAVAVNLPKLLPRANYVTYWNNPWENSVKLQFLTRMDTPFLNHIK